MENTTTKTFVLIEDIYPTNAGCIEKAVKKIQIQTESLCLDPLTIISVNDNFVVESRYKKVLESKGIYYMSGNSLMIRTIITSDLLRA